MKRTFPPPGVPWIPASFPHTGDKPDRNYYQDLITGSPAAKTAAEL